MINRRSSSAATSSASHSFRGIAITVIFVAFVVFALSSPVEAFDKPWLVSEKFAEVGREVLLPCILKASQCGTLTDMTWYRNGTRIISHSESNGLSQAADDSAWRLDMEHTSNSTTVYLKTKNVKLQDEGLYRCESTYSAEKSDCDNVQHVALNITVTPVYVRIMEESTLQILHSATYGPVDEGSDIGLICESGEGRPVPTAQWFKGDQLLEPVTSTKVDANGIGSTSSTLKMQATREKLGETYTCSINSSSLLAPLTANVTLDIHVRPLKMDLNGVVGHAVRGTIIFLECVVSAARPAANITWYNGTEPLTGKRERYQVLDTKFYENNDTTLNTESYLKFTASEYENGKTFSCMAENPVIRTKRLKPMKEIITFEVLYPPIIKLEAANITVNESEEFVILCDYEANPATLSKVTWLHDGKEIPLDDEERYDGGTTEQTALIVKNATEKDMGSYKCILENSVNASTSKESVNVSVLYRPKVEVITHPDVPVNEEKALNVSLSCSVLSGNPKILTAVRWYLDGDLLKELPDCTSDDAYADNSTAEGSDICENIDPTKLLLEAVGRSFHGNYSCEGRNEAGWSEISRSASVVVYYIPGPASISYEPKRVVKGKEVTIYCSVSDPGRPGVSGFKWFRGFEQLENESKSVLTIESVDVRAKTNFSCLAYNDAGTGYPATTFVDVSVAPAFVKELPPYHGFTAASENVSITCWIECVPLCNVSWLRNGFPINFAKANSRYYLSNVYLPADPENNRFESIQSNLTWNLTALPDGHLDHVDDGAKFECRSSENDVGPSVKASTNFHIEFAPEDLTISKSVINVTADEIPEAVSCDAKAYPEATFRWFREHSNDTIMEGRIFDLKTPIPRRSNGTYYCEASNVHGTRNISLVINVQFKPKCEIKEERIEDSNYVSCTANGNPDDIDFTWFLDDGNETLDSKYEIREKKSYVTIDTSVTNYRTYVCIANNSIGQSSPCELSISGDVPWWYRLDGNLLLIAIIVAIIVIIAIIIVCAVIIIICRRKRNPVKKYSLDNGNNNQANGGTGDAPETAAKTFYENLPFHGIQEPPDKAFSPGFSDLDYADVDYRSYGPINYKAASIALFQQQQQQQQKQKQLQQQQQQKQTDQRRPQMYGVSDENEELL